MVQPLVSLHPLLAVKAHATTQLILKQAPVTLQAPATHRASKALGSVYEPTASLVIALYVSPKAKHGEPAPGPPI